MRLKGVGVAVLIAAAIAGGLASPALAQEGQVDVCPTYDGKYELGSGWEGAAAAGITVSSASDEQVTVTVAAGYTLVRFCYKTGQGGGGATSAEAPVVGPASFTIAKTNRGGGISHAAFDTEITQAPAQSGGSGGGEQSGSGQQQVQQQQQQVQQQQQQQVQQGAEQQQAQVGQQQQVQQVGQQQAGQQQAQQQVQQGDAPTPDQSSEHAAAPAQAGSSNPAASSTPSAVARAGGVAGVRVTGKRAKKKAVAKRKAAVRAKAPAKKKPRIRVLPFTP